MSTEKKAVEMTVQYIISELKKNPSSRFSKSDYQTLIWAILADKSFKAKKYVIKNDEIFEVDVGIDSGMFKFLDKLLKHAGVTDTNERARIIEGFEYTPRDVEWIADAVDEAMYIYTESGKNMKVFRNRMLELSFRKMIRTGKYAGKVGYKKTVVDHAAQLAKKKK